MVSPHCNGHGATAPENQGWEEAKEYRYNCDILTALLREQVPILNFVEWSVTCIEQGAVRTMLPLSTTSTNQHCTHQAALFFLAADYTGGIALASLIPQWPVIGVHPIAPTEKSMALWLVKGEIKFFRPSVGCLEIIAQIEPELRGRVKKRYEQGKTVLETVTVRFRNGAVDVAEATMTYYARQSDKLRTDGATPENVNILYQHKLVSSAELIAGVRARESGGLFEDPFAARIAGEHGLALASRFCEKSPQLGGMVAARTRHQDLQILEFTRNGGRDIVHVGVGYDMRPFRLPLPPGTRVYELDFPTVLTDRQRRLRDLGVQDPAGITRIQVPIDLRTRQLADALKGVVDFTSPLFVGWEGMSMYFEEAEVRAILAGMAPLLHNNRSRMWLDLVDRRAVFEPEIFPEVKAFMTGMQLLGEPFVFGVESVEDFIQSNGLRCHQAVSSDVFLTERSDPVYSIYHFCTASVDATDEASRQQPSWTAHPAHAPLPVATITESKSVGNAAPI